MEDAKPLDDRLEVMAGLLKAYGDVRNQPTEPELWAGCKDAAPLLDEALATIRARDAEIVELRAEVERFRRTKLYLDNVRLTAWVEELEALLRKHQWAVGKPDGSRWCPDCRGNRYNDGSDDGHYDHCKIRAILRGEGE